MTELAEVAITREGERSVVSITGEVDLSNVLELAREIEDGVESEASVVVLDLSRITYLDSAGIRFLLQVAGRLQLRRQEVRLRIPPSSPIRSTVDVAGIAGAIPLDEE
ncbi:MAG: STAS domain-containing protein [Actinobacteria bacterium]|nr:STAS domain-containing protein [Actinomycetota bacterium]